MSVQIETNAVSENFVIDYSEEQVTVRLHPDCTGCISVHVVDDTVETLEFTLQHDGESCPVHEKPNDVYGDPVGEMDAFIDSAKGDVA